MNMSFIIVHVSFKDWSSKFDSSSDAHTYLLDLYGAGEIDELLFT